MHADQADSFRVMAHAVAMSKTSMPHVLTAVGLWLALHYAG